MSGVGHDQQSLRDLLDAIRLVLGFDPIYRQVKTSYLQVEQTLDHTRGPEEWFVAGGNMPDETRSRDASVHKAMKKLSGQRTSSPRYEKKYSYNKEGIHPRQNRPHYQDFSGRIR